MWFSVPRSSPARRIAAMRQEVLDALAAHDFLVREP